MIIRKMILVSIIGSSLLQPVSAEIVCPSTEYDSSYKSNLPIVDSNELITAQSSLLPGGKVVCKVSFNYETLKNNSRTRIEEGVYKGIKYRIYYSDGSGSVQGLPSNTLDYVHDKYETNWSTGCKKDEMDDTHWCSLDKGDLRVGIWKDGSHFVWVGGSHYPGSSIAVRIDKGQPISAAEKTGFSKQQSESILGHFKKGEAVLTRYQEWPYTSNKDKTIELFGFNEAWEILGNIYRAARVAQ